jgi:hypothetical protein
MILGWIAITAYHSASGNVHALDQVFLDQAACIKACNAPGAWPDAPPGKPIDGGCVPVRINLK